MFKLPWMRDRNLKEAVRLERGKLADAVIKNDRVRSRLYVRVSERPVGDMISELFQSLDEAKRRE